MIAAGVNTWKKLPGTGIGGTPSTAQATPNTNATVKPLGAGAWQPKPAATPAAQPAAKPVQPAPAGQSAIRQYLLDNGIGNDQIGYNKANNSVTVGGQSFITPATVQGGTSYATKDSLDQALAGYQNKQTYNKANELLKTIESGIGTYTPGEFSYNAASDPQYQMALQNALAQAGVASGDAMADFAARGILDSDVTRDRVAQIRQSAVADVNTDLLPQMMQQAYQRYSDGENRKYQASRDQFTDRAALLSSYLGVNNERQADAQQAWDNNYALNDQKFNQGMATKQYDRGVLESDRNYDRSVLESDRNYDRGVLESDRNYDRGVLESDRNYGLAKDDNARQWASYNLSKSNSAADNSRANSNASYGRLMDIWQATGKAPAGLEQYGVQPGTPYGQQQSAEYSYSSDPDFADDMGMLMKNPTTALSEIQRNAQALISKYGYDGYEEFLKQAQLITPKQEK